MEFIAFYTDYKTGRFQGIKNASGKADAKSALKKYLIHGNMPKSKILYVMLPDELPKTVWNKIHDQNMRMTDLHSASVIYGNLLGEPFIPRTRARQLAVKTFSQLPKKYQDVIASFYLRTWWPRSSGGLLIGAIDANVWKNYKI